MLLLALLAATQSTPVPGSIKTFGDWTVACDNAGRCEMTSLMPGDGMTDPGPGYDVFWMSIARDPGPRGGFTVEVSLNQPAADELTLEADGVAVAKGLAKQDGLRFTGAEAARIVAAIADARALALTEGEAATLGQVSLAGSSAALRFIDARQGRVRTATAAVARGVMSATMVPAPPPLPVVRFVKPGGAATALTPAIEAAMAKAAACGDVYDGDPPAIELHALGGGATLALLPCGSGAYNFSTVPFVIRGGQAALARFDFAPGWTEAEAGTPTLVNAGFEAGRLSSFTKARGLGDCGSSEEYMWDGAMFRLVEARRMDECRTSVNWLRLWTATAVPQ